MKSYELKKIDRIWIYKGKGKDINEREQGE